MDLGSEVTQSPKGPLNFVGRIVDEVKKETAGGCRIAVAVTNSPHSPKLHVIADGKRVDGFDDVVWHSLTMSPDGKHVAFVANREGKQVCVRDGRAGNNYEKIGRMGTESGSPLVFSSDGQQLGYVVQMHGRWRVVVNDVLGPEFDDVGGMMLTKHYPATFNGLPSLRAETYGGSDCPVFSADGQNVFYLTQRKTAQGRRYAVVLNGISGPEFEAFWGAHLCPTGDVAYVGLNGFNAQVVFNGVPETEQGGSELVFSADGKRRAYIGGKAGSGARFIVVDGKPSRQYGNIENLRFSPDGSHVAFNTYVESSGYRVVLDDVMVAPVDGYRISRVYFSGDGSRTVFLGEKSRDAVGDKALIEAGCVTAEFLGAYWLTVSPDCRRVAYCKVTPGRGQRVVLDGIEHPEFRSVDFERVRFSSDSRHLTYVAHDSEGKWRVVADGVVGPPIDSLAINHPVFASETGGWAYAGKVGGDWIVFANGVAGPKLTQISLDSFVFSEHSTDVAYVGNVNGARCVVRSTSTGPLFSEIRTGSLSFSPDGKHLTYVAADTPENGDGKGKKSWRTVIDATRGPSFSEIGPKGVVFSSDSRNSAYVARMGREEMVVINGLEGPRFSSIEVGPIECSDGRLEYIGFEGAIPRRKLVRVTVRGFSSVALH